MQASCPQCSQKIVIDDAKVPDRAFSVKCPKCQSVVKFPGKAAAAPPPSAIPAEDDWTTAPAASEPPPSLTAAAKNIGQGLRALVALTDRQHGASIGAALGQLAFGVDTLDNPDEGARLIEQGVYAIAVTSLAANVAGRENLYQRIGRMPPEARRRLFVAVIGEEFKTGDGVQAWSICADLVVNPRDAAGCAAVLANTIGERTRVYQAFNEARRRFEESAS